MKVQILKTHNRFQMQCSYNTKVLKVIKKINKRYYCKNNKTWYLPLKDYPTFKRRYNSADCKMSMPQAHLEEVIALSTELGFKIVITDEVLFD